MTSCHLCRLNRGFRGPVIKQATGWGLRPTEFEVRLLSGYGTLVTGTEDLGRSPPRNA